MHDERPVGGDLYYGEDLTYCDAENLRSFLTARTALLADSARGSDERLAARSVRTAALMLDATLEHCLSLQQTHERNHPTVRAQVTISWNALCSLAQPWMHNRDYDHTRWRLVKYWNRNHEREIEEKLRGLNSKE
ncbi:hypothetical protein [Streptomyces wuyuanensis]|uniref:hypothetical protein n=1 Tax=Streptomyces wuyuanensis TaxID=1196353 RepID=UPI0034235390